MCLCHPQIDQAALTGESLPAKKFAGDVCFSGSTIKQGEKHALVYATGKNTFFGRAAALIAVCSHSLSVPAAIEIPKASSWVFCPDIRIYLHAYASLAL